MVIRVGIDKLRSFVENRPVTILDEVAEAGRKAYCTLYTKNPGWIFVRDNLTLPFVVRYSNDLCRDYPPPPPYTPSPFEGGQCQGTPYAVTVDFIAYNAQGEPTQGQTGIIAVGKITAIAVSQVNPPTDSRYAITITDNVPSSPRTRVMAIRDTQTVDIKIANIIIVPTNGSEDNCGNVVEEPFPPPSYSPDNYVNNFYTVENIFGDEIDYYVEIQKDGDNNFTFPFVYATASFRGTLDIGGITIKNRFGGGNNRDPKPLEEEEEEGEKPPEPTEITETISPVTLGLERNVTNCVKLKVTMLEKDSTDAISGGLGSPEVRYWGWFMWSFEGYSYPRQFLHFNQNTFEIPEKHTGYSIYIKKGYIGSINETRLESNT